MPYKDPEVRRKYKHEHYMRNREKVLRRVREYERTHPDVRKRASHKYNQKKNAPYHAVADEAGLVRECVECGSTENLGIHHIDGNHENNEASNLQWMCVSCHAKLHAMWRRKGLPEATGGHGTASEGLHCPEDVSDEVSQERSRDEATGGQGRPHLGVGGPRGRAASPGGLPEAPVGSIQRGGQMSIFDVLGEEGS